MGSKHSQLNQKNLAQFTKDRDSLKVVGEPRASGARSNASRSIFTSNKSRANQSGTIKIRGNAEQHKRRIMDVVNNLNEEELEKVSEMLRAADDEPLPESMREGMPEEGDDERLDEVDDLRSAPAEDQVTSVSKMGSQLTSKSAVQSLQNQLHEEQNARKKLERELEELQKFSSQIMQHMEMK